MINKIQNYVYPVRYALLFWTLVGIRMYFNGVLPLMDKTEARYGEIARLMRETGNWITPQIDYGVPFWAKPPLSTWASALSIRLFGSAEFFVRFPYLLLFVGMAFYLGRYRNPNQQSYYLPGIILLSIPEFYLHAGVVSTDSFLCFSIALAMLGFWESLKDQAKAFWGYLFFTGLGLGLLAKGPIIGILTLPPILLWTLFNKNIKKVFFKLPWVGGIVLMLGISIPWYVLAELRTPGFFDYFIIGEHFERYLNSEWKGDKYGFPKQQPLGMAWVFLILFLLPWTVALIRILIKKWKSLRQDPWVLFLLLWTLWTPFFFTSSKSLIHPYILPCCIPVALIISHYWQLLKNKKIYFSIAFGLPVLLFLVHLSGLAKPLYSHTTDKFLIGQMEPRIPVFSLDRKTYSSQFYTQGKIKVIEHSKLEEKLLSKNTFYILLNTKQWEIINDRSKLKLQSIDSNKKRGIYLFSPVLKDGD